ncbi:sigma 54-interacting transcriptional regulator [bacterium]|nr:sigma 54-interacting transcriptional regulator [bacterium]
MLDILGQALSSIGERKALANSLLSFARDHFGGDHGFLLELEETTGSLREIASFGDVEEMLNQDMRIFMQYSSDHPTDPDSIIVAPDAKAVKKLSARKSVRRDMTKGVLLFPLASGDRAMGAIYLGEKKSGNLKLKGVKENDLLAVGQVMGQIINLDHVQQKLTLQNRALQQEVRHVASFDQLVGTSDAIGRVRRALELVTETDVAVTLIGEDGTGRSTAAEALHFHSLRKRKPLVVLPLDELPEAMHASLIFGAVPGTANVPAKGRRGALRDAKGGTLVLEGIDTLNADLQDKLVATMDSGRTTVVGNEEDYQVDVRYIFTTSKNPRDLFESKQLAQDFYLKLNIFPVVLPPLRDRVSDMPILVEHFIEETTAAFGKTISGVSSEVYDFLGTWEWPNNLDELEHEIRQAVLRAPDGGTITPAMLSTSLISRQEPALMDTGEGTLKQRIARIEKRMIMEQLERNKHNQSITADQMGLSRQALINKLHRYGIETGRKYKRKMREIAAQAKKGE